MGKSGEPPKDYENTRVHFVFDVKHDDRNNDRLVVDGNLTEILLSAVYSGLVSLRGIMLVLFSYRIKWTRILGCRCR